MEKHDINSDVNSMEYLPSDAIVKESQIIQTRIDDDRSISLECCEREISGCEHSRAFAPTSSETVDKNVQSLVKSGTGQLCKNKGDHVQINEACEDLINKRIENENMDICSSNIQSSVIECEQNIFGKDLNQEPFLDYKQLPVDDKAEVINSNHSEFITKPEGSHKLEKFEKTCKLSDDVHSSSESSRTASESKDVNLPERNGTLKQNEIIKCTDNLVVERDHCDAHKGCETETKDRQGNENANFSKNKPNINNFKSNNSQESVKEGSQTSEANCEISKYAKSDREKGLLSGANGIAVLKEPESKVILNKITSETSRKSIGSSQTSQVNSVEKPQKSKSHPVNENQKRMNYLIQASKYLNNVEDSEKTRAISSSLGSLSMAIGRKCVLRMTPTLKRQLCKGCGSFIIAGISAKCRLRKNRQQHLVVTCNKCKTIKRLVADPSHELWCNNPDAIVD